MKRSNLAVEIGQLKLKNPVLTAAGPVGFGSSYSDFVSLSQLGGLVLKSLSLYPRTGSPPPRLWETASGLLNNIGFDNPGLDRFVQKFYPNLSKLDTCLVASIIGEEIEEYRILSRELSALKKINALEVNVYVTLDRYRQLGSQGYLEWAQSVVAAVIKETNRPVWVKLSPDLGDIEAITGTVAAEGASAVTVANSFCGMALDIRSGRSRLGSITGGLSGPAIKPLTLRLVWQIRQVVGIPVIGVGGILDAEDAIEFLLAGASAVGIGTGNFVDPQVTTKIISGIEEYLRKHQLKSISQLETIGPHLNSKGRVK